MNILGGVGLIVGSAFIPSPWWFLDAFLSGIISLIWGLVVLLAAFALMRLEYWAWALVVVVNIINILLSVLLGGLYSLVISLIVVVYLFYRRDVFH